MAHSNNPKVNKFWQDYSQQSAVKVKLLSETLACDPEFLLGAKRGKEELIFEVGQQVKSTGKGQIKEGVFLEIKDRWIQNGYVRYLAGGVVHQASDLSVK